jgi:hypothetical protein
MYEKIVSNRLNSFFDKNSIIDKFQYGFRPRHSTYMAPLDLYDRLTESIEADEFTVSGRFVPGRFVPGRFVPRTVRTRTIRTHRITLVFVAMC